MVQHLLSMCKSLGLFPNTKSEKQRMSDWGYTSETDHLSDRSRGLALNPALPKTDRQKAKEENKKKISKLIILGARNKSQQLRTLAILPMDLDLIPSMYQHITV